MGGVVVKARVRHLTLTNLGLAQVPARPGGALRTVQMNDHYAIEVSLDCDADFAEAFYAWLDEREVIDAPSPGSSPFAPGVEKLGCEHDWYQYPPGHPFIERCRKCGASR